MTPCAKCEINWRRESHAYCAPCHAAYMREWRKTHRLAGAARLKDNARSYAGVYKRRGIIKPDRCEDCGAVMAEMHHEDYAKPKDVVWLCRRCHLSRHDVGHLRRDTRCSF